MGGPARPITAALAGARRDARVPETALPLAVHVRRLARPGRAAGGPHLSEFDLLLRLVDFAPLRPVLAHLLGWTSGRGWIPFDPLSLFLLSGWQLVNGWTRGATLTHLADPRYRDYAQAFGFRDGVYPTEGGLRYFLTALGQPRPDLDLRIAVPAVGETASEAVALHRLNYLLAQAVQLLVTPGFISAAAWEQALLCPDGMIQLAASRMRCTTVNATCYAATSAATPRTCAAKLKERRGCDCDTTACAEVCRFAPPRDTQARCVWYTGSNQPTDSPNQANASAKPAPGRLYYGYRSLPLQLADPQRRCSLVLVNHFQSAEASEEPPATAELLALAQLYPTLPRGGRGGRRGVRLRTAAAHHLCHLTRPPRRGPAQP